jgi:hypothetical protein
MPVMVGEHCRTKTGIQNAQYENIDRGIRLLDAGSQSGMTIGLLYQS